MTTALSRKRNLTIDGSDSRFEGMVPVTPCPVFVFVTAASHLIPQLPADLSCFPKEFRSTVTLQMQTLGVAPWLNRFRLVRNYLVSLLGFSQLPECISPRHQYPTPPVSPAYLKNCLSARTRATLR